MNWNGWKIALEVKEILKGDFTSQASIGQLRAKARDVSRATDVIGWPCSSPTKRIGKSESSAGTLTSMDRLGVRISLFFWLAPSLVWLYRTSLSACFRFESPIRLLH